VLCQVTPAQAEVSIGVNIGINVPVFPSLVQVPGYPVYYDPAASSNYFFYDGLYWIYQNDNWYASSWYNGPWELTDPNVVPLFVLRVPIRFYHHLPAYFHGWRVDGPPHWGEHWGNDWKARHNGWNQWDHNAAPHAAPLPIYQRQYSGDRYPHAEQQQNVIRSQHYHYQPREPVTQQHFQQQARPDTAHAAPAAQRQAPAPLQQRQQQQQPVRQVQPAAAPQAQPMRQVQPAQQMQHPQAAPQGHARSNDQGHDQEHRDESHDNRDQGHDQDHR
jgi:hypothetical protein